MIRVSILALAVAVMAVALAACGGAEAPEPQVIEVPKEVIVEKEVIKEVPVEVVVEKEVVREVQVPGVTQVVEKIVEVEAPTKFGEAPMLAQLVLAGKLPPVEERVPDPPLVIPVFREIGKYGGTARRGFIGPTDVYCNAGRITGGGLVRWTNDGTEIIPNIAVTLEPNGDGTVWTAKLREGMKWSDGAPFTADDFVYMATEVQGDDSLKPGKAIWYKGSGDTPVVVTKVDDTTVKFTYPLPYWHLAKRLTIKCIDQNISYTPAHYMKQFMPQYNPDAEKIAKDAGNETWQAYYNNRLDYRWNPDKPSAKPWLFNNPASDPVIILERNPFYHGVDPAGNQLPYIDFWRLDIVTDKAVLSLKAIQGELDFQARHIQITDFPVLKENEDKGGYVIKLQPSAGGVDAFVTVNLSVPGELGKVMNTQDFRLGLSAAIDREFVKETINLGFGKVRNVLPTQGHPHHPGPEWETKNIEYDVDRANELLDMVIPNRGSDGYRTLPSGESFQYFVGTAPAFGAWPEIAEHVANNFKAVGINSEPKISEFGLLLNQARAGEMHGLIWHNDYTADVFVWPAKTLPGTYWAPGYGQWWTSKGAEGPEPPDYVKQLLDWWQEGQSADPENQARLGKEIYRWHVENQVETGIIGQSPMSMGVAIVSKRLGNVPETWANDMAFNTPMSAFPEQFYFKE